MIQDWDDSRSKRSPPWRGDHKVLEARCRSPVTLQRDLKRARIVLFAAEGRSTRSIAKEVRVQPRIVSLWRHRYAEQGLDGLEDKARSGKKPIYTKTTDKRILRLLDKPPPEGFARWTRPLLAAALCDVDVQYVWRFLRHHKIDLEVQVIHKAGKLEAAAPFRMCRNDFPAGDFEGCEQRGRASMPSSMPTMTKPSHSSGPRRKSESPSASVQRPPYHSTLIPGTSP